MRATLPLFVDLDGTLIKTDLLVESFIEMLKQYPLQAFKFPFWLLRGKAYLKEKIAALVLLNPAALPYDREFLDYLNTEHQGGRKIYLATASNQRYAHAVASHLGIFSGVMASSEDNNLSGVRKLAAIQQCAPAGFVYAGNDNVDLPIWHASNAAILVNVPAAVQGRIASDKPVEASFNGIHPSLKAIVNAIRPHQWLKNILVFLPVLPIVNVADGLMAGKLLLAFAAFSLCASSVYLLNDLSDLEADRAHPRKSKRPFASGALPALYGLFLAPVLVLASFAIASLVNWMFVLVLAIYWISTSAYTFFLKRFALIDVITLAGLYTLRVIAGSAAIAIKPSFWILAFSMFVFFSLALAKRYAELESMRVLNRNDAKGRGYWVSDSSSVQLMGIASGYLAVMVMALYINSPEIMTRYQNVEILWGVCPLLMLWISRVWLKSSRGEMTDDPLVFAAKDKMSRVIIALAIALVLVALF